jgi:hypothetical protein
MHATASAATASAAASHWTARGAGPLAGRKTPQMPMNPRTAIWMVCQPRAEAESLSSRSPGAAADRGTLASSGSIDPAYCKRLSRFALSLAADHLFGPVIHSRHAVESVHDHAMMVVFEER